MRIIRLLLIALFLSSAAIGAAAAVLALTFRPPFRPTLAISAVR